MGFVSTRRVGSALISLIREGTGRWAPKMQTLLGGPVPAAEWRQAAPGVDASGAADIALSAVLVRLGTATVLVDCCLDDPSPDEPWGCSRSSAHPASRLAWPSSASLRPTLPTS